MFMLGVIISGTSVFAAMTISADQIEYAPNVSVKDKIDDLYTKVKPPYSGDTTFTPDKTGKTFSTNGKYLNSNIVVNPIPNKYVDISDTTVTNTSQISSGLIAYKADGTKLTGTGNLNCINGSFTHQANTEVSYNFPFTPTSFILTFNQASNRVYYVFKDSKVSSNIVTAYGDKNGLIEQALPRNESGKTVNSAYHLDGNHIYSQGENGYAYTNSYTIYYIACY